MEWIVATVLVLVFGCSLISFLIARATCRNYRSQEIAAEKNALLSQIEKQQVFNDAQVVVNEAQQELNDAAQEYMNALRETNEALEAKLDEQYTEFENRHQIIVAALISIKEIFNVVESSDDTELSRKKFVELRMVLNTVLDTWKED